MPDSGTALFTDAVSYRTRLPGTSELVVTQRGDFRARLTWVDLSHLYLIHARETLSRVALVSPPVNRVFIAFSTTQTSSLRYDGTPLLPGDVMIHASGQHVHQRIIKPTAWALISLSHAALSEYSSIIGGQCLTLLSEPRIVRPRSADWLLLRQLHASATRIVETKLENIGHPEVIRALDQDLISTLVVCLTSGELRDDTFSTRSGVDIVLRLEAALTEHGDQTVPVADMCRWLGISERVLRSSCATVLGVGPAGYSRLRRLRLSPPRLHQRVVPV